jgi:cobalt-zinc-cadmium efflux system membrane fusion protein
MSTRAWPIACAALAVLCGRAVEAADEPAAPPRFTVAELERFGVMVASAGSGIVDLGVDLPGEVRPDAERTAHIAPQFAGRVREVRKAVGDAVRAGEVLAIIESDTLAPFPLTTAMAGVVIDRHVVAGEAVDRNTPAFVIADLSTVWVEINVYQKDLPAVTPGARVQITAGYDVASGEGSVGYVSPILDQVTRTARARVVLPNPEGRWRPGLFVTAHVFEPLPAAVVAPRTALQRVGGETVVFAVEGDHFAVRPVRLGRQGRTQVEILAGLKAGERYASDGSFLLKAELTAAGAEDDEHEH